MKKTVVFGFLGTKLDALGGFGPKRWTRWRPTVGLTQQPDFAVDRLELLVEPHSSRLAGRIADDIAEISPGTEVRRIPMAFADPWDFEEVYGRLHDFARQYPFDLGREDYLVHITTGTHVAQICWFLLTEARYFPARLLQTSPPARSAPGDPIKEGTPPHGTAAVIDLDLSRYDRLAQRFAHEQAEAEHLLKAGIATQNAAFNKMIGEIERVARASTAPILLLGPTGAGKSFLARRIFELKKQRQRLPGRLVEANCATLRGDSAMSALFGHVKGAFTGATGAREGLLRAADGGVLLLDEIGELGLDEQAMLLKAIEEKRFFPFGSDAEAESRFQLIAGTCRDLHKAVREGRFREDLYARINLWTFRLPGLAERVEDIAPNLDFELARHAQENGELVRFSAEARKRYLDFAASPAARWPGNFRELAASVTRLATLAEGGRITEMDVDAEIVRLRGAWEEAGGQAAEAALPAEAGGIDWFDRCQLEAVLAACRAAPSLSEAGRRLFACSRLHKKQPNDADRLRKYLARFGLDWAQAHKAA